MISLLMLGLILQSQGFTADDKDILQAIMDSGKVQTFVDTTDDGNLTPILFMTNNLLPEQAPPSYRDASIVISDSKDVQMSDYTTIEIVKFKRTKRKADISMICHQKAIRFKLKDTENGWDLRSFKLKARENSS